MAYTFTPAEGENVKTVVTITPTQGAPKVCVEKGIELVWGSQIKDDSDRPPSWGYRATYPRIAITDGVETDTSVTSFAGNAQKAFENVVNRALKPGGGSVADFTIDTDFAKHEGFQHKKPAAPEKPIDPLEGLSDEQGTRAAELRADAIKAFEDEQTGDKEAFDAAVTFSRSINELYDLFGGTDSSKRARPKIVKYFDSNANSIPQKMHKLLSNQTALIESTYLARLSDNELLTIPHHRRSGKTVNRMIHDGHRAYMTDAVEAALNAISFDPEGGDNAPTDYSFGMSRPVGDKRGMDPQGLRILMEEIAYHTIGMKDSDPSSMSLGSMRKQDSGAMMYQPGQLVAEVDKRVNALLANYTQTYGPNSADNVEAAELIFTQVRASSGGSGLFAQHCAAVLEIEQAVEQFGEDSDAFRKAVASAYKLPYFAFANKVGNALLDEQNAKAEVSDVLEKAEPVKLTKKLSELDNQGFAAHLFKSLMQREDGKQVWSELCKLVKAADLPSVEPAAEDGDGQSAEAA